MSSIQPWLMALASMLIAQPWLLTVATTTLIGCVLLVTGGVHLRHRSRLRPAASAEPQPPLGAGIPPSDAATLAPIPYIPSAELPPKPIPHLSITGPLSDRGNWRQSTDASTIPGRSRTASAVLTPIADGGLVRTMTEPVTARVAPATHEVATVAAAVLEDAPSPEALADLAYRQGLALLTQPNTDREASLRRALTCLRRAQEYWTRERAPERWAAIQNDIGRVYQDLPPGDRGQHMQTAILHHESALEVFDPANHPLSWAWTQAALGAAYLNNPRGSTIANARAAVAYYQRALDVFTPENTPLAWAWNQNNLGAAFETLRGSEEGERVAHLHDAVSCYEAALRIFTEASYPTQHELATRNRERVLAELAALE